MTETSCCFDPFDWESFFFGALERDEANALLCNAKVGSFLLRESKSRPGGYSLSVRESDKGDHQIYHYFIEKKELQDGKVHYEMCKQNFVDIPSLINHYKIHVLEKSCLLKPVDKPVICKVIGRFKFDGERATDLPFDRGEVLEVIGKPEEAWWLARNCLRSTGLIPVPYVKIYDEGDEVSLLDPSTTSSSGSGKRFSELSTSSENDKKSQQQQLNDGEKSRQSLPAWVKVIAPRQPSIYDVDALPLKQGQLIYLMEILPNGMCRGVSDENGKIGLFPFTYVEFANISLESGPWIPAELDLPTF